MRRVVLPEILDSLAPEDPEALANRRDLRRLNRVMGSFRWFRQRVAGWGADPRPAVEWAAGDGTLGAYLFSCDSGGGLPLLAGVDLWPRPGSWPAAWAWWQGDLREWDQYAKHPRVLGNLILHQFEDGDLARMGARLNRHATSLAFNEPRRSAWSLVLAYLLRFAGAHPVTRHDALVSARAGFRGAELPVLLGLDPARWHWRIESTLLGAYRFTAIRKDRS